MNARIYTLPVRDHHVPGERPDWANDERQRIADRAYKLGLEDGEKSGAIKAAAFYVVMTLVVIAGLVALGAHP